MAPHFGPAPHTNAGTLACNAVVTTQIKVLAASSATRKPRKSEDVDRRFAWDRFHGTSAP
jgi:hypothetical protein